MKNKGIFYIIFFNLLLPAACVRQVKVPVRKITPLLVVEGLVTTSPGPYSINLSYSGPYTNSYDAGQDSQYVVPDARVVIRDDAGDSTTCTYAGSGNYLSDSAGFVGVVGRTYTLAIYLSNGKVYLSKPETVVAVAPIDSLSVGYDSAALTGIEPFPLVATLHARDPGNGSHYYRWATSGYIPRKSWGSPCDPYTDPPCNSPFVCTCHALCEELNTLPTQLYVYSNQFSQGQQIILPVYYSPVYWFGNHYMEVDQFSMTLSSYQFWEQYLAQTSRTGSILDPLPSPVIGNIFNAADSSDLALGIFSASDVYKKKLIVVPYFLQEYSLEANAGSFILPGDCQMVYPNALTDNTGPAGWDSAQVLNLY